MRSLAGKRKSASPGPQLAGGQFAGAVVTDPAGRAAVVPFTGSTGDVLRGDGTFGTAGGALSLSYDAVLGCYVVPA
jgi:hypothetical protein